MHVLYDSDAFVVVHINAVHDEEGEGPPPPPRHGFEIVDKRTNKEIYLDGPWAEAFQTQIDGWQAETPTQDNVEAILDSYCGLAYIPLVIH